jgi:DNA-binding beta-propeller fold protein YncE
MGVSERGAVVAGYRIESLLGRGGMGVVYRARDPQLGRDVALKVIAPELVADADVRARFLREARAAAAIEHPNVIPVHAAGERDGVAFLAMRLVDGDDLRARVRREGPPAIEDACALIEQAASGLDAIHRAGFIHRDVKPGNLLVDRSGHVYLTDFGLAKQLLTSSGATRTGRWVGTLDYIAPEQLRGGRVDARADVYALGGVLHYVLTGQVPFERDHDEAKLWAQLSEPPPAPSMLRPGTPPALDAVVARAMAKDPGERYPSAGDLARAARAGAVGSASSLPERVVARGAAAPGSGPHQVRLVDDVSTVTSGAAPPAHRRRRWAVLAGALLAAAAAAVFVLAKGGEQPPARPGVQATRTGPRVVAVTPDIGNRPTGIAFAGGDVWVTSVSEPTVTRIDAATNRERSQHPRVGAGPASIVGYRDDLWVVARRAGEVVRIDARTGKVDLHIPTPAPPRTVAAGPSGVWIATDVATGSELRRYDRDGHLLARLPFPAGVGALTVSSDAAWVVERRTRRVVRIEPRTGRPRVLTTVQAPTVGLYFGGGYLWAVLRSEDALARVDVKTGNSATVSAGRGPTQVVAVGDRLFVASRNNNTVVVLDAETTEPAHAPLHVGLNPYAVTTDGHSVWVTGLADNRVTRIAAGA